MSSTVLKKRNSAKSLTLSFRSNSQKDKAKSINKTSCFGSQNVYDFDYYMSSDDVSLIIKEEISYGYHNECYIYDGSVLDETCRLKELTYTIATVPKQEQSKVFDNEVKKADASMKDSNYGYNRRIEYC
ncbi:hypothetical protein BDAP_001050 [Binucleata daphniae]